MDLLPEKLKKTLPPLYSQESASSPIIHAKFFTPDAGWTWLITEGSEEIQMRRVAQYLFGFFKDRKVAEE